MSSEVEQWLQQNGLSAYREAFVENHVSMDMLPRLTATDLKDLGLTIGHKHAFLQGIERLKASTSNSDKLMNANISAAPPEFADERRLVTVLFCDIVESTRLSSLIDAEELDDLLQKFFMRCATVVEGFGGLLTERKGDGVACWFGWPKAHEDDPHRAVHAALTLVREIPTLRVISVPSWQLNVRIGIATGRVVVGRIAGTEIPKIVGDTPNLAERLKEACPIASVVIDPTTRRLVGANFEFLQHGTQLLKGFEDPIHVCQVVAPRAGVTRFEGSHSGQAVRRLIGREGDAAMLAARWKLACNNEGQVVLLTGQAGIGKSCVAAAFAERVKRQGCYVQLYQCSDLYRNTALHPLTSQITREAEIKSSDQPSVKLRKLSQLPIVKLAASEKATGLLASLLSIPPHEKFVPPTMSPDDRRLAVFNVILEAISRVAAMKPTLLIVEDMHWIDPSSLDLLSALIEKSRNLCVLILITSREEELSTQWNNGDNFTYLRLNRLSPSQSREFCAEIIGKEAIQKLHLEQIVAAAQGVPLFLEELVKHSREFPHGQVASKSVSQDTSAAIPDHLFSFLAERLDLLDAQSGAKQVVQTAAVFGHEFSCGLLAKVPSLKWVGDINAVFDQLLKAGLVARSEDTIQEHLSFRHSIFREVAYNSLLRSTRRRLHEEIATILIEAGIAEVEPDVVAYHLTETAKPERAIAYWTTAGLRSNEQSAANEAFSHFSKGLELIEQLPEQPATFELELPLRVGFGAAASAIEGYSSQGIEKNYTRVLELATILDRPQEKFRAHLGLGAFYEVGGDIERSRLHCEECLRSAEHSDRSDELLHAHRLIGELNFYTGDFELSCGHLEIALSKYDPDNHLKLIRELGDDPGVLSRMYNALSLWFLGFPDQAQKNCNQALELANKLGHAFTSAQADFYASWMHALMRNFARAKEFAERAIDRSTTQQFSLVLGLSRVIKGWATSHMDKSPSGEEEILEGMVLIRGPHADICESSFLIFLADYYLLMGNIEKGLSIIDEARAIATERFAAAERLRTQGDLMAFRDTLKAEQLLREAIALARQQKSLSIELRSSLSLYRLLHKLGRTNEGIEELIAAYNKFAEGFETSDMGEVFKILKSSSQP